ncbi:MAG: hypothetical protein ACYSO7_03700 [Planctomycetota bacterium]|jgi:pimeloyl-ACP methyl ester carboxylesterase
MFEDEKKLQKMTDTIVAEMLSANVAQKKFYIDNRTGNEYWNLVTPAAFDKDLVIIAVLGYPERAGVWSYTLLRQSHINESSMKPYFDKFRNQGYGLIAINPNLLSPDIEGDSYIYQLDQVITDIDADKKIGFIGFSMGGKILVDFLEKRPELLGRILGLALIDPTLPNRMKNDAIRSLLDHDTLLVASEGEVNSPGKIASILLEIPAMSLAGIHGEMPNKSLKQVLNFFQERML